MVESVSVQHPQIGLSAEYHLFRDIEQCIADTQCRPVQSYSVYVAESLLLIRQTRQLICLLSINNPFSSTERLLLIDLLPSPSTSDQNLPHDLILLGTILQAISEHLPPSRNFTAAYSSNRSRFSSRLSTFLTVL